MNTRASQSPLHSKIEALIWAMECMRNLRQFSVNLQRIVLNWWSCFLNQRSGQPLQAIWKNITILKRSFYSSEIIHIPRTQNSNADSLACSARKQLSLVVHMDAELPVWFAESSWICFCCRHIILRIFKNIFINKFY